jgi:hypothetical protein
MSFLPGMMSGMLLSAMGGSGFGSPFYLGSYQDNSNDSVYTFSSLPLGGATADRKIYCFVGTGNSTPTFLSCTIGGVTAELLLRQSSTSSTKIALYFAEVPSGNTGNVVITLNTGQLLCYITLYATYTDDLFPHASQADSNTSTVTLLNNPVNIDGYAACASFDINTGSNAITWSGVDSETLNYNAGTEGNLSSAGVGPITETTATGDWTAEFNGTVFAAAISIAKLNGSSYYTPVLASHPFDTTNATIYTFPSAGIGTAHADRVVLIGVIWSNSTSRTVSSFTVGGSSTDAIIVTQAANSAILAIPYASGTTADIVITMSGACTCMGIGVYDTRPRSMIYPVDVASRTLTATSVTMADVSVRNGGYLIVIGSVLALEAATAVYDGADTLTIDAQENVEDRRAVYLSASITENTGFTNPGFSSASSNSKRMVAASFI